MSPEEGDQKVQALVDALGGTAWRFDEPEVHWELVNHDGRLLQLSFEQVAKMCVPAVIEALRRRGGLAW